MEETEQFKVWFASHKKINSSTKLVVFDDYGKLELQNEELFFEGRQQSLRIPLNEIAKVSLVRQKLNWVTYLIVNIIAIAFLFFVSKLHFIFIIPLMFLSSLVGIGIGLSTKWVCIELQESKSDDDKIYFANSSFFGWAGIFGGTKRLSDMVKRLKKT